MRVIYGRVVIHKPEYPDDNIVQHANSTKRGREANAYVQEDLAQRLLSSGAEDVLSKSQGHVSRPGQDSLHFANLPGQPRNTLWIPHHSKPHLWRKQKLGS